VNAAVIRGNSTHAATLLALVAATSIIPLCYL